MLANDRPGVLQKVLHDGRDARTHERRDIARQHQPHPVVGEAPSHEMTRVLEQVRARVRDADAVARRVVAAEQDGRRAIAEERHANEVGRRLCLLREDQASELHRDHECLVAGPRRQHVARPDERAGAARAAEPEQRRAPHVGAQTQAAGKQRIEAWRRQPCRRDDVDVIDLVGRRARLCEARRARLSASARVPWRRIPRFALRTSETPDTTRVRGQDVGCRHRFGRTPESDVRGGADLHRVAPSRGVRMPDRGDAAGWPRTTREFSA